MNQQNVSDITRHPRLVERKDFARRANVIFSGWGPKMLALLITASAVASATDRSDAATISTHPGLCAFGMAPPILAAAQAPGWPNNLSDSDGIGTVTVRVSVDASAHVTRTAVEKTSGDFALDQEARRLLNEAKFAPSDASCATKPGDYAFEVDYLAPGK